MTAREEISRVEAMLGVKLEPWQRAIVTALFEQGTPNGRIVMQYRRKLGPVMVIEEVSDGSLDRVGRAAAKRRARSV